VAVAVLLSTAMGASWKGEAATKYLPVRRSVVRRAFVVWPGAMTMVSVLKGFVYAASTSTTVSWWPAILKKSSSFSAALMIRSKYVLLEFTGNVKPPANSIKMVKIDIYIYMG
jgi:hypothetical protein